MFRFIYGKFNDLLLYCLFAKQAEAFCKAVDKSMDKGYTMTFYKNSDGRYCCDMVRVQGESNSQTGLEATELHYVRRFVIDYFQAEGLDRSIRY